jgi:hypothetical protein
MQREQVGYLAVSLGYFLDAVQHAGQQHVERDPGG